MRSQGMLFVDTVAALKATRVAPGAVALTVGRFAVGDGLGSLYRWDPTSTAAEDTMFYAIVASTRVSGAGRWRRIVSTASVWPPAPATPAGYMTMNGGVRTLFAFGATDANGLVTVNLTADGTASGGALFADVWRDTGDVRGGSGASMTTNDVVIGTRQSLSADRKQIVYRFSRGNPQTLGASLTAILGLVISPFRAAPSGTPVVIKVEGV